MTGERIVAIHRDMAEARIGLEARSNTALVMGGGPSIAGDFDLVVDACDPFLISVKQHGLIFLASNDLRADACSFLEHPNRSGQEALRTALLMSPGTYWISPFDGWTHVLIDEPWWNGGFSSSLAVWFACACGFERVLLAGMDCYQGERKYWYDRPGYHHAALRSSVEDNLAAWRPALEMCQNSDRIRAVSGPLTDVFGRWMP